MYGWDEEDYTVANKSFLKQAGIDQAKQAEEMRRKSEYLQERTERIPSSERWRTMQEEDEEKEEERANIFRDGQRHKERESNDRRWLHDKYDFEDEKEPGNEGRYSRKYQGHKHRYESSRYDGDRHDSYRRESSRYDRSR